MRGFSLNREVESPNGLTPSALEFRIYRTLEELEALRKEWEELLSQFPTATTFSALDWLLPWWRAFGKNQQLTVVAFYNSASQLVALAPLSLVDHVAPGGMKLKMLRLMGDGSGDSDNLDLPVRPGYEAAFVDTLLELLEQGEIDWDFCELNTLPGNSPAAGPLLSRLNNRGIRFFSFDRPWLVTHLPASWEAYLEQLSSENRNNLKRYTRRLGRHYKFEIYKCVQEKDLDRCLEDLFRLHQKRWQLRGEAGTFASDQRRAFYQDLSRTLLSHEQLEFWLLSLNGTTAAAQFCFRYRKTAFLLQEGFDPDHAADRVGFVLRGHVLERLIADGVRQYDFLFGHSEGKKIWLPQLQNYIDIHFAPRQSRGSLYLALMKTARDSKEWLRTHLPERVWRILHGLNTFLQGTSRKSSPTGGTD